MERTFNMRVFNKRCFEDVKDIWTKLSNNEKQWYDLFHRATNGNHKLSLQILSPDEATFNKLWTEVVYESNHGQRNKETQRTKYTYKYTINDYINQIGAGENEVIQYVDEKWKASLKVKAMFEDDTRYQDHEHKALAKQAVVNESSAKDFYAYIESLLERNQRIQAEGRALWQQEIESLIQSQLEDSANA